MSYYRSWEPLLPASAVIHGTAMVVAPHPDDEVVGCGGIIIAHRDAGEDVHAVIMTDGGRGNPGGSGGADYNALRQEEARRAMDGLGGGELHFLGHPDGELARTLKPVDGLSSVLARVEPEAIFFPSPYEVHPDHRATSLLVFRALRAVGRWPRIYLYEIGAMMPINLLVDITPFMMRKERALAAYPSQLLHQDLVGKMRALNRCRTVNVDDPAIRYAEAYTHVLPESAERYLEAVERVIEITDSMQPPH